MSAPLEEKLQTDDKTTDNEFHFDTTFLRRFAGILRVIFPRVCCITTLLFVAVLALQLLAQVIIYNVGLIASQYFKVLGEKDFEAFKITTLKSAGLILSIAFVLATDNYACNVFYVTARQLVTKTLHQRYFKNVLYYHLNVLDKSVDNPDQRITVDVLTMCKTFSELVGRLLISPILIAYYTYRTWINTGYVGPLCVVIFFLISTLFNKILMSPVVALVYAQDKMEGDFRFKHMQIRSNAESAAFFRAGRIEMNKSDKKLDSLIQTQHKLVLRQYFLTFAIKMADYVGGILSYIVVAIPIFAGKYDDLSPTDLSVLISQNSFVTMYLINCFTQLIDMASKVTDVAGAAHRIGHMVERLQDLEEKSFFDSASNSFSDMSTSLVSPVFTQSGEEPVRSAYSLEHVTYCAPGNDKPLVKDLSFRLVSGENILVTGDSGCGKSSLLRMIDCLWPVTSGDVQRDVCHGHCGVLYLPQKPFFTDGSLRQQIIYPYQTISVCGSTVEDAEVIQILQEVGLGRLYERIGALDVPLDWNWYDMLSPGEMQRLSFVRLFYHKPPFAVLDEATSQIGEDMEDKLYSLCSVYSITLLSVGHRPSLRKYHHRELHLDGQEAGGTWSLLEIQPSSQQQGNSRSADHKHSRGADSERVRGADSILVQIDSESQSETAAL